MSEPIQSISNGTYMIGETTQTEFQAGPGISITKPSEGTVRIATDETVLYSGSYTPTNNGYITLSEPASNFEKLAIGIYGHETFIPLYYEYEIPPSSAIKTLPIIAYGVPGGNTGIRFNTCKADFNDAYTTLTFTNCGQKSIEGTSITSSTFNSKIYKVVGINRKENA